MSDQQWRFLPEPMEWSMAHVAEHVVLSNRNLHHLLSKRLAGGTSIVTSTDVSDAEIPYLFYRADEPPDFAPPTGDWKDRHTAAELLRESSDAIVEWAGAVATDLRQVGLAHPLFGLLDGIQWLMFIAAHTERHRAQLIGLAHRGGRVRRSVTDQT